MEMKWTTAPPTFADVLATAGRELVQTLDDLKMSDDDRTALQKRVRAWLASSRALLPEHAALHQAIVAARDRFYAERSAAERRDEAAVLAAAAASAAVVTAAPALVPQADVVALERKWKGVREQTAPTLTDRRWAQAKAVCAAHGRRSPAWQNLDKRVAGELALVATMIDLAAFMDARLAEWQGDPPTSEMYATAAADLERVRATGAVLAENLTNVTASLSVLCAPLVATPSTPALVSG